jgi:hypothetical protein
MLLDEIIELLSSQTGSLTDALLKTKVLLHQIGKKELIGWVNFELNGYPDDNVPPYRIVSAEVLANFANIAWRYSSHPIPLAHLPEKQRENLTRAVMKESLAVIEASIAKTKKGGSPKLIRNIPVENNFALSKGLGNDLIVRNAWCELNMRQVENIVVQVRSRLLDFVLELKDSVGNASETNELQQKAQNFDANKVFNATVYGDNNTVLIGDANTQTICNSITRGDFDSLSKVLSEIGIPDAEIADLQGAITEDEKSGKKGTLEGKAGSWFARLLGRAAHGGIGVTTDIVSSVVFKALAAFIGLSG